MAEPLHIESPLRRRLLQALADGGWHSGQALAELAGVSRAAVWKQMDALEKLGLGIERARGRGYRLSHAVSLLDEQVIRDALSQHWRDRVSLSLLESVASTNAWLADQPEPSDGRIQACMAEAQPQGRGRRGRVWHCPYGGGIPLSVAWHFEALDKGLSGLAPSLAVAVARALESLGADAPGLKWPNDIVCDEGKLGGILIELKGESAGPCQVRVGVGLNWVPPAAVDQPAAGLAALFPGAFPDRSRVAGRVLDALCSGMSDFARDGFEGVRADWKARDVLAGKPVRLALHDRSVEGRALGLDAAGALRIQSSDGAETTWQVGEVSVRLQAREETA
jgi:BirA family transcriptional regulator, biotin operon repressor / biotin---[acetyl-CoA-carboxylase] ligase